MNNSKDKKAESTEKIDTDWINDLCTNFINSYVDQITNAMTGDTTIQKYFKRDDTVNGIQHPEHIMYKLIVNPKHSNNPIKRQNAYKLKPYDHPDTEISTDPHRRYEFVIEFDKGTPGYGIYYGCRGLIRDAKNEEDSLEHAKKMYEEWAHIEKTVTTVLNNTFPQKDFTRCFRHTNNDNNYTFWPFWIALGDNEDILGTAVRATIIIYKCYHSLLLKEKPRDFLLLNIPNDTETYYTETAYNNILECITTYIHKYHSIAIDKFAIWDHLIIKAFESFICKAETKGYITRDPLYEKAWRITKDLDNKSFYALMMLQWQLIKQISPSNENQQWDVLENARSIINCIQKISKDIKPKYKSDIPQKIFDVFLTNDGCRFKPGKLKNIIKNDSPDMDKIKKAFRAIYDS